MAEAKTQPTSETLASYLKRIEDPERRADCSAVADMMAAITKKQAVVWGRSIVGFDSYEIAAAGGKSNSWPTLAFAARASDLTIYLSKTMMADEAVMAKLGKAKQKGGCLHIKRLADVDVATLKALLTRTYKAKNA